MLRMDDVNARLDLKASVLSTYVIVMKSSAQYSDLSIRANLQRGAAVRLPGLFGYPPFLGHLHAQK
jgi:hypothetical protein